MRPTDTRATGACPVCDDTSQSYLFAIAGMPIGRCEGCGLVSAQALPPGVGPADGAKWPVRDGRAETAPWTDSLTEQLASNLYLDVLRTRGMSTGRLLLIVPQPESSIVSEARQRGFEIGWVGTADDLIARGPAGVFDACLVLYQLERSSAPSSVLLEIHRLLRPGGVLVVVPPSLDSWPAGFFRDRWTEWRGENRFYFDQSTLQSIFLKSGFGGVWFDKDRRSYTLQHIFDRAAGFPHTALTRVIGLLRRLVPPPFRSVRFRLPSSRTIVSATRVEARAVPMVSIVVPVFNERETFPVLMDALLAQVLPGVDREIILVESNSSDGTREIVQHYASQPGVRAVYEERPRGKGYAVRTGLAHATGDIVLIQDADLEYDLNDYAILLAPLLARRALFVLGSRHGGSWKMRQFADQPGVDTMLNLGHVFFTGLLNLLYRQHLTDPFTMFKVFYRDCLFGLEFECCRFDFDHELVIKLVSKGYRPLEIPVNYRSRSFKEGKKVTMFRDPMSWIWVNVKFRFVRLSRLPKPPTP